MSEKEYIELFGVYFLNKVISKINPLMVINRYSRYGYIKKISHEEKNENFDIAMLLRFGDYNNIILNFFEILSDRLPHCNQTAFINGLRTVNIEDSKSLKNKDQIIKESGSHCCRRNKIILYLLNIGLRKGLFEENLVGTLNHELLHMASTYKKGIVIFSGFEQNIGKKFHAGSGLNEGYTELLNRRYFSSAKVKGSYPEQQFIALGIEQIIGREKMETLYFNADLEGLVEELSKYVSVSDVHKLLRTIDACHRYDGCDEKFYKSFAAESRIMVANIYNKKMNKLYEDGILSEDEYNFSRFRSYCYVRGYALIKHGDDYGIENRYDVGGKKLSSDGYGVVMKKFLSSEILKSEFTIENANNENGDFVDMCYFLNRVEFGYGYDLSKISNIDFSSNRCKIYFYEENAICKDFDFAEEHNICDDFIVTDHNFSQKR